jgi:2'-5' RNA ligase
MKRLFAAIKVHPSDQFLKLLFNLKRELAYEKIKWVSPGNIHITLKFFGETPESDLPVISEALGNAAARAEPLTFTLAKLGIFGSSYKPKVVWVGIKNGEAVKKLGEAVLNETDLAGWKRDRQNFVPHLTIGRIKFLEDKKRFQEIIAKYRDANLQEVQTDEIILYESILRPEGPDYHVLERYGIGGL